MSMMMPPQAPPGLPVPPGGGDPGMGAPPMDAMNQGPMPAGGGIEELLAALGGGGGAPPGAEVPPGEEEGGEEMDASNHIRQAIGHLMMAMTKTDDDQFGAGVGKGLAGLQAILGGEAKKDSQMAALSG